MGDITPIESGQRAERLLEAVGVAFDEVAEELIEEMTSAALDEPERVLSAKRQLHALRAARQRLEQRVKRGRRAKLNEEQANGG